MLDFGRDGASKVGFVLDYPLLVILASLVLLYVQPALRSQTEFCGERQLVILSEKDEIGAPIRN